MNRKKIVIISVVSAFALAIGVFIWKLDIPSWQRLDLEKIHSAPLATSVLDADGNIAGNLYSVENRRHTTLSELPKYIPEAFIAAEDARFYSHSGIDVRRIIGALWHDLRTGSFAQGASTITQQLIKLTHLTSEKTISRKAQEAYLALSLERRLEKDEILEAYLNTVYFGSGAYGIGAAADVFFDKDASELTIGEAALLAGIIKSPSGYSPYENPEAAKKRREYVLSAMAENGFIDSKRAKAAMNEQISLAAEAASDSANSWYMDEVAREAQEILKMDADELFSGGYVIHTALNADMQSSAADIMENGDIYPDSQTQGALIAMNPDTGEICALIGGREYSVKRGLNRATASRRQTGSVIKPISTYAAAVDKHGYLPTTIVYDIQREYPGGYSPGNAGGEFNGSVTLRTALSRSLNAATVDLADTIGIGAVCDYAGRFGVELDKTDENLAFSLGSMAKGATPAEICGAYCALANGGARVRAHAIRRIEDRYGNIIYDYKNDSDAVLSAESAYIITDMLKTASQTGTARRLSQLSFPVAAKTGTAGLENGDTCDIWTAAYTPDLAVTVWMGHDSNETGGMAPSVTGGGYAAPVCADFLDAASKHLSGRDFSVPDGLTPMLVDGYLLENSLKVALVSADTPGAYSIQEIFRKDDLPTEISAIWDAPLPVDDLSIARSESGKPLLSFTCRGALAEYMVIRETGDEGEIITVLRGTEGEKIQYEDISADTSGNLAYTVIPRHILLYENGQLLTADYSTRVKFRTGIMDGITRLLGGESEAERIESGEIPLF